MLLPVAVSVTARPGAQELVGPVMVTVGPVLTETTVGADTAEQPFASVTVTE